MMGRTDNLSVGYLLKIEEAIGSKPLKKDLIIENLFKAGVEVYDQGSMELTEEFTLHFDYLIEIGRIKKLDVNSLDKNAKTIETTSFYYELSEDLVTEGGWTGENTEEI